MKHFVQNMFCVIVLWLSRHAGFQNLFAEVDLDGNGVIDLYELCLALQFLGSVWWDAAIVTDATVACTEYFVREPNTSFALMQVRFRTRVGDRVRNCGAPSRTVGFPVVLQRVAGDVGERPRVRSSGKGTDCSLVAMRRRHHPTNSRVHVPGCLCCIFGWWHFG